LCLNDREGDLAHIPCLIRLCPNGHAVALVRSLEHVHRLVGFYHTYDPREILRLIEPITNDFCDVVVGSRLGGKITKNAFKAQNRLANWIYTFLVRCFYGANITDVLSGYFAWRADVVYEMRDHLKSDGFSIEMEMISKLVKLNYSIYSVPITYNIREGETKIESIKDGFKILFTFSRNLFWSPLTESAAKKNVDLLKTVDERETADLLS